MTLWKNALKLIKYACHFQLQYIEDVYVYKYCNIDKINHDFLFVKKYYK